METDMSTNIFHPPHPAWDRIQEIIIKSWQVDGADVLIGRRLPELLETGGLIDVRVEARADVFPPGHPRRTIRLDLIRSVRAKAVARGVASQGELDDLDQAARAHLEDPHTLALPHLFFLAWGRKPADGPYPSHRRDT